MKFSAIALSALAASLGGCADVTAPAQLRPVVPTTRIKPSSTVLATFEYTGMQQIFTVPAGVTQVTIVAKGASGGKSAYRSGSPGLGAIVSATIAVTPGSKLRIHVGGQGTPKAGGYNGGGDVASSVSSRFNGGGGGGCSDVRQHGDQLKRRVVVAAGGGGAGDGTNAYSSRNRGGSGGAGNGLVGNSGGGGAGGSYAGRGGSGGSQTAGGAGGEGGVCSFCYILRINSGALRSEHVKKNSYGGCNGSAGGHGWFGHGGAGSGTCGGSGGGGGGGYYGGGGGGSGAYGWIYSTSGGTRGESGSGGGGGGGSSYAESSATNVQYYGGVWSGNGEIVISTP